MGRLVMVALVLLAVVAPTAAQSRQPVELQFSGDDFVGTRIAHAVKEQLAGSALFQLATDSVDIISILSLDAATGSERQGRMSALSVQFTLGAVCRKEGATDPFYWKFTNHSVLIVGRDRADDEARRIVAEFSQFLDHTKKGRPDCAI